MSWSLEVDSENCVGSGMCTGIAPEHFTDASGITAPVRDVVEPDDVVTDAAESCPVEAIVVRSAQTGERIAPPE